MDLLPIPSPSSRPDKISPSPKPSKPHDQREVEDDFDSIVDSEVKLRNTTPVVQKAVLLPPELPATLLVQETTTLSEGSILKTPIETLPGDPLIQHQSILGNTLPGSERGTVEFSETFDVSPDVFANSLSTTAIAAGTSPELQANAKIEAVVQQNTDAPLATIQPSVEFDSRLRPGVEPVQSAPNSSATGEATATHPDELGRLEKVETAETVEEQPDLSKSKNSQENILEDKEIVVQKEDDRPATLKLNKVEAASLDNNRRAETHERGDSQPEQHDARQENDQPSAARFGGNEQINVTKTTTSSTTTPEPRVESEVQDKIVNQVSDNIKAEFERTPRRSEFRFQLDPPELGSVRIHLRGDNKEVSARIFVATDMARSVIDSQLQTLKQNLQDAGISLTEFEVSQDTNQQQWSQGDARSQRGRTNWHRLTSHNTVEDTTNQTSSTLSDNSSNRINLVA